MAWHFRWEMRARIARTALATALVRNECSRCPKKSAVARSFFRRPPIPAARRPAGFDSPKPPGAHHFRRCHPARCAVRSTSFQTARPSARVRIRTGARTSARCSGCGQTTVPRLLVQDSYLLFPAVCQGFPTSSSFPLSTLVSPFSPHKSPHRLCTHLNNRFPCIFGNISPLTKVVCSARAEQSRRKTPAPPANKTSTLGKCSHYRNRPWERTIPCWRRLAEKPRGSRARASLLVRPLGRRGQDQPHAAIPIPSLGVNPLARKARPRSKRFCGVKSGSDKRTRKQALN